MLYILSIFFLVVFSQRGGDRRDDDRSRRVCPTSNRDWRDGDFSQYSECWWWGDPHFMTFDDFEHHFQGRGEYYYVKQCLPKSKLNLVPFTITGVQTACPRRPNVNRVSCVSKIKINLVDGSKTRVITLQSDFKVSDSTMSTDPKLGVRYYFNGGDSYYVVTKSLTNGDNWVQVEVYTGRFLFVSDVLVRMNKQSTRGSIELNEYYEDLVCGLCGYYDGRYSSNDLTYYNPSSGECEILYPTDNDFPVKMRNYDSSTWNIINTWGRKFDVDGKSGDDNVPELSGCTLTKVGVAENYCKAVYDEKCRCNDEESYSDDHVARFISDCVDQACAMHSQGVGLKAACEETDIGCSSRCRRH